MAATGDEADDEAGHEADGGADEGKLRRVYGVVDPIEVRDYYDSWASSYDAELVANGYATPARVAEALAGLVADRTQPLLDYGCGTGLSGEALRAAGFSTIDGADPSTRMLAAAEAKQIYRSLTHLDLDALEPPFDKGEYPLVTAIGLIGPGAAPLDLFDQLFDLLDPGGLFGLSFNDHAMTDPAYPAKIEHHIESRTARLVFEERGPHLPGLGVDATVYVLERAAT